MAASIELIDLREKLREQLLEIVDKIQESGLSIQEKTISLLSVIAQQIIEARFCLEEIKSNTE